MSEIYRNTYGKERVAYPPEVALPESQKRRAYYQRTLEPRITSGFVHHGIDVAVQLVGSVARDQAGPGSDIDCLVSPLAAMTMSSSEESWQFLSVARIVALDFLQEAEFPFDLHCVVGDHTICV